MSYTAYILYSERHQKNYTGFTSDLNARLLSHNQIGKDWTVKYRPWELLFTKQFDDKAAAKTFEKWLKSGVGRDFVKTLHIKH